MTKISAGSYDLNKFLYGGYEEDIITTIYGDAGAGKTNFCILAAVSQTKKESNKKEEKRITKKKKEKQSTQLDKV